MGACKELIKDLSPKVFEELNAFTKKTLLTRGGRIGSGMGLLIEALWGYFINIELKDHPYEVTWFPDHQYNDFACLYKDQEWRPETKHGEALRIEVKSMNIGAEESKAHFDILLKETSADDLLMVIVWEWALVNDRYYAPLIIDHFIDSVEQIINLRDKLHVRRGGSFVVSGDCPDGCHPGTCSHEGEPLNAAGKRERITGPASRKPSENVSYAANFGGLIRMLKTSSAAAFQEFAKIRKEDEIAHRYISFIHKHYPAEELNQYSKSQLDKIAKAYNIHTKDLGKPVLFSRIREKVPNYQEVLRNIS